MASLNCLVLSETSFDKVFSVNINIVIVDNNKIDINKFNSGGLSGQKINLIVNIDYSNDMNLWTVDIDEEVKPDGVFTEEDIKQKLEGSRKMGTNREV